MARQEFFFQVVKPTRQEDMVEPETGIRYTEASVNINRDHLEEFFGDYHCSCVAISGKGSKISRHAAVTYACEYSISQSH